MNSYNNTPDKKQQESLDVGAILLELARKWYLFLGALAIALGAAYIVNRFTLPLWQISSTVLISVQGERNEVEPGDFLNSATLFSPNTDFSNELLVLKSTPIVYSALDELELYLSYFEKREFMFHETYDEGPFTVNYDPTHLEPINLKIEVEFLENDYVRCTANGEDVNIFDMGVRKGKGKLPSFTIDKKARIGEVIQGDNYSFSILMRNNLNPQDFIGKKYAFEFYDIRKLTSKYQSALNIEPLDANSTVAIINLESTHIKKGIDFIEELTKEYLEKNLEKKNHLALKTIEYIDRQLNQISDSLNIAESKLQEFRRSNQVMDINLKSSRIYQQLQDLENQRADLDVKSKYYTYLYDYFQENEDVGDLVAPSAMGIEDQLLTNLIQELTTLSSEKNSLQRNNQEKSPYYSNLTIRIENLKKTIVENIKNLIRTSQISLEEINDRISKLNREVNKLPVTERTLVGIERKYKLNDEIYTYFLQRRAEAQIARASNLPDNEIIEPAKVIGRVKPNTKINYILSVFMGLLIPGTFIVGRYLLQDTIGNRKELGDITKLSLLGTVPHNNKKSTMVVTEFPKSAIAESFRSIRTNLDYYTGGNMNQVFLITSTVSGEGKTFNAMNLATALALTGRKTLLLGFDLRKPSLQETFGLNKLLGISSYMINKANLEDMIHTTRIENLDVITSGEIPPNPVELIASDKTHVLIEQLKTLYNYIIIDTPPLGLVTDAFLLMKHSDVNIYIVREKYTSKKLFKNVLQDIEDKDIKRIALVFNDSESQRKGYGYGYGYYEEGNTKKGKKGLFSRKKKSDINKREEI